MCNQHKYRMQPNHLRFSRITWLFSVFSALGCSTDPNTGTPNGDAGTALVSCPAYAPAHSSSCSNAGQTCQWEDVLGGIIAGYCDGMFWRAASRDRGCPSEPGTGACGQFSGGCSYLIRSSYQTAGLDPIPDTCLAYCYCSSGQWTCSNSCTCPGKSTQEPAKPEIDFGEGCLHQQMRCEYRFQVGDRTGLPSSAATQPCDLIYTCKNSSWELDDRCSCPVFELGKTYAASLGCYGAKSLQCIFPPLSEGAPSQICECVDHLWTCK